MSFAVPRIAVGLPIPNCSFSISGRTANAAAGWDVDSVLTTAPYTLTALFGDSPANGHARAQRITVTGAGEVYIFSSPATPGKGCIYASTKFYGVVLCRFTRGAAGNNVTHGLAWHDDTGMVVDKGSIHAVVSDLAGWDVRQGYATKTPTSGASDDAEFLSQYLWLHNATGDTMTFDIAFADVGMWDGGTGTGYYEFPKLPSWPGTDAHMVLPQSALPLGTGGERVVDRDRFTEKIAMKMALRDADQDFRNAMQKAWYHQKGRSYQEASANPGGGSYPLLITTTDPALPRVGLFKVVGDAFPMRRQGRSWAADPSYYDGDWSLLEVHDF